jgi:hypothetical protein
MKKVMPFLCNLYNRWSNKRLIRLLALLLALAVPAPVLLGGDDDHDHNNGRDHGRFVDPIVGSWIVHVTVTFPTGVPRFDNLTAFFADGITTSSDPSEGTGYGVWKKVAPRTYFSKFLTIVPPAFMDVPAGSIDTIVGGPSTLNPQGDQLTGPFHGFETDPSGKVIAQYEGTVVLDRISFSSIP